MEKRKRLITFDKEPTQECFGFFDETRRTSMHIGNTTYLVGIHFEKDEKESLEDKVKSIILGDIQNGKIV